MSAFLPRLPLCSLNPLHLSKFIRKTKPAFLPCRNLHAPPPPENKENKEEGCRRWSPAKFYSDVEKLGKEFKESLSPKRKGDWKDVVLMSFSFALYVYIAQRIVCIYCAWISTVHNNF